MASLAPIKNLRRPRSSRRIDPKCTHQNNMFRVEFRSFRTQAESTLSQIVTTDLDPVKDRLAPSKLHWIRIVRQHEIAPFQGVTDDWHAKSMSAKDNFRMTQSRGVKDYDMEWLCGVRLLCPSSPHGKFYTVFRYWHAMTTFLRSNSSAELKAVRSKDENDQISLLSQK